MDLAMPLEFKPSTHAIECESISIHRLQLEAVNVTHLRMGAWIFLAA